MSDQDPRAIGQALETIALGDDEQELAYDPRTGKVEATRKGEIVQDKDRVPATQMAREGFFA